jgi:hypothetical protein
MKIEVLWHKYTFEHFTQGYKGSKQASQSEMIGLPVWMNFKLAII